MDLASAPPSALAEPSAPLMEQLVDAVERGLSERGQECLDALVGSAQALSLRDTSPAAMLVAALSATAAAQAREDEEVRQRRPGLRGSAWHRAALPHNPPASRLRTPCRSAATPHTKPARQPRPPRPQGQVYDLAQQVEAQAAAAAALLDGLGATLAELERSAARAAVEAETHRHKAPEELAKVAKYRAQQAQHAANLEALGYDSKVGPGRGGRAV